MTEKNAGAADDQGKPGSEDKGTEADPLQQALAEFDDAQAGKDAGEQTGASKEKTKDTKPADGKGGEGVDLRKIASSVERFDDYLTQQQREEANRDIRKASEHVAGDTGEDLDIAEGWLEARARKDPKINTAFLQRRNNPAAYQRVLEGLKTDFAKARTGKVDRQTQDERDAVNSAVRAASTSSSKSGVSDDDVWNMGPGDWAKYKRQHGIYG